MSKNPSEAELLLVCSEAAFEAAKVGRNRVTQAILPVDESFGLKQELLDVLEDDQCQSLIAALGVGIDAGALSAPFMQGASDLSKLRYGSVIVVAEQGEPGHRVGQEILLFFSAHMRSLVEAGHVVVPEAPLEAGFTQERFAEQILDRVTRRLRPLDRGVRLDPPS